MFERIKPKFDSVNEECGIFGIYSNETRDLARSVYYGLYALQHRGQQSSGIAVSYGNQIVYHKDAGLVSEVFHHDIHLHDGDIACGHVRYAVSNEDLPCNSQPLVYIGKSGKMALCHNGKIVNAEALRQKLIKDNVVFQTATGAEVIAALINRYSEKSLIEGIKRAIKDLRGSYSLIIMTTNKLIAVRDSFGMCPLVLGKVRDEYVLSSETCGLDAISAEFIRDINPGEILEIDSNGLISHTIEKTDAAGEKPKTAGCIFEYIYLARPDSVIDGCSVYKVRKDLGKTLAKNYSVEADIVAGVPDSALVAAMGYSEESKIPYAEALMKNRYVGRTFIQPLQKKREETVNIKLNAVRSNIKDKRVVLIDDSIVRGTTSKKIVEMLRRAGAKEVHLRISSPIIPYSCYFGIDTQKTEDLIGSKKKAKEICEFTGADSLEFLTIPEVVEACKDCKIGLCTACFSGQYPIKID